MIMRRIALPVALVVAILCSCARGVPDTEKTETPARIRPAAWAGTPFAAGFYSRDRDTLSNQIDQLFRQAKQTKTKGLLVAAVVPHAGYVFSGRCAASVYRLIEKGKYKRVIILGPWHERSGRPFRGISLPGEDLAAYRTPLGDVPIDHKTAAALRKKKGFVTFPNVDAKEHSIEVQLPFLQKTAGKFLFLPLVCCGISDHDIESFAERLAPHVDDATLLLASSDFTHHGRNFRYTPFKHDIGTNIHALLDKATKLIAAQDLAGFNRHCAETRDTICGQIPIKLLVAVLKKKTRTRGIVLDKYASGDKTGNYDHSVSYGSVGFFRDPDKKAKSDKAK